MTEWKTEQNLYKKTAMKPFPKTKPKQNQNRKERGF